MKLIFTLVMILLFFVFVSTVFKTLGWFGVIGLTLICIVIAIVTLKLCLVR